MPFVQFYDDTQTKVVSLFGCPQDSEEHPNQAEIENTDPRYVTFYNSMTTYIQEGMITPE